VKKERERERDREKRELNERMIKQERNE